MKNMKYVLLKYCAVFMAVFLTSCGDTTKHPATNVSDVDASMVMTFVNVPSAGIEFNYDESMVFEVVITDAEENPIKDVPVLLSYPEDVITLDVKGVTLNTDAEGKIRIVATALINPIRPVTGTINVKAADIEKNIKFTTYKFNTFSEIIGTEQSMSFVYPDNTTLEIYSTISDLDITKEDNVLKIKGGLVDIPDTVTRIFKLKVNNNEPEYVTFTVYRGNGTEEYPYVLANRNDLEMVRKKSSYSEADNYLMVRDISLEGSGWEPIGSEVRRAFRGTFNGGGYKITGLTIDSLNVYQGLFGFAFNSSFKNLTITGNITGTAAEYSGLLIGSLSCSASVYTCAISGVNVEGTLTVSGYGGGIAGQIWEGSVSNSSAEVDLVSFASRVLSGGNYTGGIVGNANNVRISGSYTVGRVRGNDVAGGIAGYSTNGAIVNCFSTADVEGGSSAGGLVGETYASTKISNSYATGSVVSKMRTGTKGAGGIYGTTNRTSRINRVIIENNVALNKSVENINGQIGRVMGVTETQVDPNEYDLYCYTVAADRCYALSEMTVNGEMRNAYNNTFLTQPLPPLIPGSAWLMSDKIYYSFDGANLDRQNISNFFRSNVLEWDKDVWDLDVHMREYKLPILIKTKGVNKLEMPEHLMWPVPEEEGL